MNALKSAARLSIEDGLLSLLHFMLSCKLFHSTSCHEPPSNTTLLLPASLPA